MPNKYRTRQEEVARRNKWLTVQIVMAIIAVSCSPMGAVMLATTAFLFCLIAGAVATAAQLRIYWYDNEGDYGHE